MKKVNRTFYYLAFANLTFFLGNAIYILFPVFLKNLGASESMIGVLNNVDKILIIITSLAIASFVRVKNKILLLRAGYFILILAFLSYMLIDSLTWLILLIRIVNGIGFPIALIMGTTIVFDIVPIEDAAEAIGIYGVTGAISNAISPFFCEVLLSKGYSFYVLFMISVVLVFISLCVTFIMPKQPVSIDKSTQRAGFSHLFKNTKFLIISIATIIFGGGFGVIITYLPNFILETTTYKFSYFFITYIAVLILIRFKVIGRVSRINKEHLLMGIFIIGSLTFLFINFLFSVLMLFLIAVMYGLNHGILYPVLNSLSVGVVEEHDRGKANAMFSAFFNGGMMLFSFPLGFLIDFTGTYLAAFDVIAVSFLIGIIMIFVYSTRYGSITMAGTSS